MVFPLILCRIHPRAEALSLTHKSDKLQTAVSSALEAFCADHSCYPADIKPMEKDSAVHIRHGRITRLCVWIPLSTLVSLRTSGLLTSTYHNSDGRCG